MYVSRRIPNAALIGVVIAALAPLVGVALPSPGLAMSVSPVYLDMVSAGPRSRADIRVVNRSSRPLPVETVVSRITYRGNGEKTARRNEADFLVLPMQAMIPANGRQIFKVQWLGEPLIEESREYQISINQLPVAEPGEGKSVQIVMNMTVVVTVAPPEGQPALELVNSSTNTGSDGKRVPVITVRNPSKVHARFPDATLRLRGGDWQTELSPGTLEGMLGIGAVMPGQTRSFQIPLPLPETVETLRAKLDYQATRQR